MDIKEIIDGFVIKIDNYPAVTEDQTLEEAISVIQSNKLYEGGNFLSFSTLVILDNQRKLTGMISIEQILRELYPGMAAKDDEFEGKTADFTELAHLWEDSFFRNYKKHQNQPVKSIAQPMPATIKLSDPILKALALMLQHKVHLLPVIDKEEVMGILRICELFTIICRQGNMHNSANNP